MIKLIVISVSRHHSSLVKTTILHWEKNENQQEAPLPRKEEKEGGEWEEIELRFEGEEKPTILVGNTYGNAFFKEGIGITIVINNPALFGQFKVNDIVTLTAETVAKKGLN
jgi:hypothetical protein